MSNAVIEYLLGGRTGKTQQTKSKIHSKKFKAPKKFGFFLLKDGQYKSLARRKVDVVFGLKIGNRGMAVDGLRGTPSLKLSDSNPHFIGYDYKLDYRTVYLRKLKFLKSLKAIQFNVLRTNPRFFQNVYQIHPAKTVLVNLWRAATPISLQVSPLNDTQGLFKFQSRVPLSPGIYALYLGKSLHDARHVFTTSLSHRAHAYFFEVLQK